MLEYLLKRLKEKRNIGLVTSCDSEISDKEKKKSKTGFIQDGANLNVSTEIGFQSLREQ